LSGSDANKGQVQVASLISLEGIAVITWKSAGPIALVRGPGRCLEGQPFFDRFKTKLINIWNSSIRYSMHYVDKKQDRKCYLNYVHKLI
jgi:hypothetical protein